MEWWKPAHKNKAGKGPARLRRTLPGVRTQEKSSQRGGLKLYAVRGWEGGAEVQCDACRWTAKRRMREREGTSPGEKGQSLCGVCRTTSRDRTCLSWVRMQTTCQRVVLQAEAVTRGSERPGVAFGAWIPTTGYAREVLRPISASDFKVSNSQALLLPQWPTRLPALRGSTCLKTLAFVCPY